MSHNCDYDSAEVRLWSKSFVVLASRILKTGVLLQCATIKVGVFMLQKVLAWTLLRNFWDFFDF